MIWAPSFVAAVGADVGGQATAIQHALAAHAPGLALRFDRHGLVVHAHPSQPFFADRAGNLVVLGPVYDRDGNPSGLASAALEPLDFAQLIDRYWGRYLAFRRDRQTGVWDLLRDPSGAITPLLVNAQIGLVADELPHWLLRAIGLDPRPHRRRLANALAVPAITAHRSLLGGVEILPAGGAAGWTGKWSAPHLVWRAPANGPSGDANPHAIRRAVLAAARASSHGHPAIAVELSGGLDSAIVLGALREARADARIVAVNIATPQASGDEHLLARDAATHHGVELVEIAARQGDLDYRVALEGPQPALRNGYGLDSVLEGALAGICRAFDATAILTGQGGDAVFFQFPSDRVAFDLYRDKGLRALRSSAVLDIARRCRLSIWRLHWHMLTQGWRASQADRMPPTMTFLTKAARGEFDPAFGDHPWVVAARHLPPAKRFQVFALANGQWFNGPARRRLAAELIHPLLAQPVIEACLAMPSYRLSYGTQDRALARALFGDLLPPSIARRRSKGETSAYYRRAIVDNLSFLRPHLLDGCLVAAGLLDPDALAAVLEEDALIWRHDARGIVSLASLESWARHWGL